MSFGKFLAYLLAVVFLWRNRNQGARYRHRVPRKSGGGYHSHSRRGIGGNRAMECLLAEKGRVRKPVGEDEASSGSPPIQHCGLYIVARALSTSFLCKTGENVGNLISACEPARHR